MKKLLLLIGFAFSLTMNGQAPAIQWQKTLGGTDVDRAQSIQPTSDGGYVVAGYTLSSDGDVTGNHVNNDFWVVKLDATGAIIWQKALGGTDDDSAYSIESTADGGYIVAGYTYSNDGDVTGNHGSGDVWVVKLSATGAIVWQKTLGGTGYETAQSIQPTSDGGYIMAGFTSSNDGNVTGNHGGTDAWVVKLSDTGDIIYQKALGGTLGDNAFSIQSTADGGYIMAGYRDTGIFSVVLVDVWVVKLSATGTIVWQKTLGGSNYDIAQSIQITSDGGYILSGYTSSNDGDVTGNHGAIDVWVLKLNATGDITWQKTLGGTGVDDAKSIQTTSDGGYIMAGFTSSNDGDVTGNHGSNDFWVVKLDATGAIIWQKALGGTDDDSAFSIESTADGGYIVAGYTLSNDEDVTGNHGGNGDFWVGKLYPDQLSTADFTNTGLKLYPNPTCSIINIQSFNGVGLDKITITDLTGKIVIEQTQNTTQVSVEKLATGVYILNGYSEGNKFQEKFIKE